MRVRYISLKTCIVWPSIGSSSTTVIAVVVVVILVVVSIAVFAGVAILLFWRYRSIKKDNM